MSNSVIEQARFKGILESLQQQDPNIEHIVAYSKFVVAYLLQQDGPNPGWRKANIEGPVYIIRRRGHPRYQLLVNNQFSNNDLLDNLHPDWELDCQKNYVFYKVEDANKRIRGLWFHDDAERQRIEAFLEKTLEDIRSPEPQSEPQPRKMEPPQQEPVQSADATQGTDGLYTFGHAKHIEAASQDSVTISMTSVRTALHALADDENFLRTVMQKLKETQTPVRPSP